MSNDNKSTITLRVPTKKKAAIDSIASTLDRDRSFVINEAIDAYLDLYQWQIEHIEEGINQADKRQFAAPKSVKQAFARWRK